MIGSRSRVCTYVPNTAKILYAIRPIARYLVTRQVHQTQICTIILIIDYTTMADDMAVNNKIQRMYYSITMIHLSFIYVTLDSTFYSGIVYYRLSTTISYFL